MVQFRNIEAQKQAKNLGFKKKSTLSFVKLAADRKKTDGAPLKPAADENRKLLYEDGLVYLNEVLSAIRNDQTFSLDKGLQIIRKLATGNPAQDPALIMSLHLNDRFKFVLHHGVNVAIYAIKLSKCLEFKQENQIELGLTALLHDVGTAVIPDKIIYKRKNINAKEVKIFQERPNYSYKILQQFGSEYAYLAECAAQIHEYAQIIGLLDKYEALIHSRPQRDKLAPLTAIKEIINTGKDRFERKYLKALLNTFTVFPLHSYVRLNSDAIGKVIETYPDQPMRPKVRIEYDSQNQKVLTDRVVALPEDSLLHIVDSVTDEEIRQLTTV